MTHATDMPVTFTNPLSATRHLLARGLYRVAGADAVTMEAATPAARAKFAALGAMVVIVFGVAWAGMAHMIGQMPDLKGMAWLIGLVWGVFWAIVEILIISSAKSYQVGIGHKAGAFLLRAALALIPVLTFTTIWFIETNRPEIKVAVETLRVEREAKNIGQISATTGAAQATQAAHDLNRQVEALRQRESEVPPVVMALMGKVKAARADLAAIERRSHALIAGWQRSISNESRYPGDGSASKIAGWQAQIARAETEIKEKNGIIAVLSNQATDLRNNYLLDIAKKREALEAALVAATGRATEVNRTFDARSSEVRRTINDAAQENFASMLTGMFQLLENDVGKQLQFAFWFVALFTIEVAAIVVKIFFVTDADVALAHHQMLNIARTEQQGRIILARLEADANNALVQAQWEKEAFRAEDLAMAAQVADMEAQARLRDKQHSIKLKETMTHATAPFEAITTYLQTLSATRREVDRDRRRSSHGLGELLEAAEDSAAGAIRGVISGGGKAARAAG